MSLSRTVYQNISKTLLEKIAPLYELCPWDDLFNDTKHGSRELDSLVADALCYGTPDEIAKIRSYNEALHAESVITITNYESEDSWKEKVIAAKVLLERIDPFVNAVLAYYNRVTN